MILKTFLFNTYNVISISLLLLSSLTISAQGLDLFDSKLDTRELSPVEYYEFINQINNSKEYSNRSIGNYSHKLDSLFWISRGLESDLTPFFGASVFRYDIENNIDTRFAYRCEGFGCTISPNSVRSNQYNDTDQILGRTGNLWDGSSYIHEFELPHFLRYYYEDELLTSLGSDLVIDSMIYNDDRNLERAYQFRRSNVTDSFMLSKKYFYKYNDLAQLENMLFFDYVPNFGGFTPVDSIVFIFNDLGELTEEIEYRPEQINPVVWGIREKRTYKYENNLCSERVFCSLPILEVGDTIWQIQEQTIYNYHQDGSLENIEYFDIFGPSPIPIFLREFLYDRTITKDEILLPRDGITPEGTNHMLIRESAFRLFDYYPFFAFNNEFNQETLSFFYKPIDSVSTLDTHNNGLHVYLSPNPVSNILNLQLSDDSFSYQLNIFDSVGRPYLTKSGNDTAIDVSHLPSGTYHYSISSGKKVGSGSFVKM